MTTYILPKTLDFTYCSDVEDEETFVQLPNNSTPKPVNKVTHWNLQMKADMADDYSKTSCFEIRKSLEMKKPSNNSPAKSNKSIWDNDTQWDTSDSDSEGEIFIENKVLKIYIIIPENQVFIGIIKLKRFNF